MQPQDTYQILLVIQALHLLHHRMAKRHISFVEALTGLVLCVPPTTDLPPVFLMASHLALSAIQLVGSIFIKRLSPEWSAPVQKS